MAENIALPSFRVFSAGRSPHLAGDGRGVRAQKVLGSFFSLPLAPVAHRPGAAPGLVRVLHHLQVVLGERLDVRTREKKPWGVGCGGGGVLSSKFCMPQRSDH